MARWGQFVSLCDQFKSFDLVDTEVTIGRRGDCTVQLRDPIISGCHCVITRVFVGDAQHVYIRDQSLNGTWLNNDRIKKGTRKKLADGTEVFFSMDRKTMQPIRFMFRLLADGPPRIEDVYTIGDTLGTGAFAVVKKAVHKATGKLYAVKKVDKRKLALVNTSRDLVKAEVDILRKCDHVHIVKFQGMYDSKRYLYIVLEYVDGGELFDHIIESGTFPEADARGLFRQIAHGIAYLHKRKISHRDLKPENILLKKFVVKDTVKYLAKISDFGMSRFVSDMGCQTMAGTPQYLAPEIIKSANGNQSTYDHRVDMWSLGVILYILLSGAQPFNDTNSKLPVMEQILQGVYSFPKSKWGKISQQAKEVVRRLLTVNPDERMTATELLEHPWLRRGSARTTRVARTASPTAAPPLGVPTSSSSATLKCSRTTSQDGLLDELVGAGAGADIGGRRDGSSASFPKPASAAAPAPPPSQGAKRRSHSTGSRRTAPPATARAASAPALSNNGQGSHDDSERPPPRRSRTSERKTLADSDDGEGFPDDEALGEPALPPPPKRQGRRSGRRSATRRRSPGTPQRPSSSRSNGTPTRRRARAAPSSDDPDSVDNVGTTRRSVDSDSDGSAGSDDQTAPPNPFMKAPPSPATTRARVRVRARRQSPRPDATPSPRSASSARSRSTKRKTRPTPADDDEEVVPQRAGRKRSRRGRNRAAGAAAGGTEDNAPVVRTQPVCPYGERCYRTSNPKHVTEFFHPHLVDHG